MSMNKAVCLNNVTKIINGYKIIDNINFDITQSEICGLYGKNGSGKSMLLKLISGLVNCTSGKIEVFGDTIGIGGKMPKDTGILIEQPGILPEYSAFDNLKILATIKKIASEKDIIDALNVVGLEPNNKKPSKKYSLGMKQKLALAQAIFERPRLLLLDEPTSNLDTDCIDALLSYLKKINSDLGTTIVIVSHQKDELKMICHRICEISNGSISYC